MTGTVTYNSFATLNIGLGTAGDAFTITDTHAGTTTVNGNNGDDVFNIKAISGPTTANGGNDDDTFNVGSNAAGTVASPSNNTGGNLHGIGDDSGDVLTINGNDADQRQRLAVRGRHAATRRQHGHADVDDDQRPWPGGRTSPTAPSSTW